MTEDAMTPATHTQGDGSQGISFPVLLGVLGAGLVGICAWQMQQVPGKTRAPVEHMTAAQCQPLFDAVVSDALPNVHQDDRDACAVHFASWVKSVPDTPYRVDGKQLEVRNAKFSLTGAQAWRTSYAVGNESLPAVLVILETTAATLRFQKVDDADAALRHLVAGGAAKH